MIDISSMTPAEIIQAYTPPEEVMAMILKARRAGRPYSLVRVGDGENAVLSQILGEEYLERPWARSDHSYCGIVLPNFEALYEMIWALRRADMVGILFQDGDKWWREMTQRAFAAARIYPRRIMYAFDNHHLVQQEGFTRLLETSRVVLLGRRSEEMAGSLAERGMRVVRHLMVDSYDDVAPTISALDTTDYQVCLAACGVNAVMLCQKLAFRHGTIALDVGSAFDRLLDGSLHLYGEAS